MKTKTILGFAAAASVEAFVPDMAALPPSEAMASTLKHQVENTLRLAKSLQEHETRRLQDLGDLPLDGIDPALLENLDLYPLLCTSGLIEDFECSSLEGIILEQIPGDECDDDKDRVCALTADISSIVQDRSCQQSIGLNIPSEIQDVISAGSYCFNTLLCGSRNNAGGSIERCLDQVSGVIRNAEELVGNIDDAYIADIISGVDAIIQNPISVIPTTCENNCYDKFTNILRSGYDLLSNGEDCVAALQDMDMQDVLPGLPADMSLPIELPSMDNLPSLEGLPADGDVEEYLLLAESACLRNDDGDYCVEEFYNLIGAEFSDWCEPLADLGCCTNLVLTNPVIVDAIGFDADTRTDIFDQAAQCDPPETALQRPCTDGLRNPVSIVTSAVTVPSDVYIEESTLIDAIAAGAGVPAYNVIITEWTNRVTEGGRRLLQDTEQMISFEIVLSGAAASDSDSVSDSIVSDDFAQQISTATGVAVQEIVVEPPATESFGPEGEDDDEISVALIAGAVVGGLVAVGLVMGGVFVMKTRGAQRSASRSQGIDANAPQAACVHGAKGPANLDV